ncbi:MAG: LacI family DNA-binding transcriptional regulator, partial [Verrucomicrobiota bacterium]
MKHPIYHESTATLDQVAKGAGVSRQTAGRILGDFAHKHKPETVERVKSVARKLGYRPNLLAKSMVAGRTQSIGVLLSQKISTDNFFADILTGIQYALTKTEFIPITLFSFTEESEYEQIHRLVDRRVDGLLLIPQITSVPPNYLDEIIERGIPLVCVNERIIAPVDINF